MTMNSLQPTSRLLFGIVLLAFSPTSWASDVFDLGSQRYLLFDDHWLEPDYTVTFVQHSPQKKGVVLEADKPWENLGIWPWNTVMYDDGVFKLWYDAMTHGVWDGSGPRYKAHLAYAISNDGIHWEKPKPSLNFRDDPQYGRPGTDFYNNGVIKYPWAHHAYFMRPSAFHHPSDTLEIHLATSRDGIIWRRPGGSSSWIGLGPAGSFDSHQLYITSGIVRVGDELWVYYTGFQAGHRRVLIKESHYVGKVGRAVLRLDGFVSARGGSQPATLTTKPLRVVGRSLVLNYDAGATGDVRVELRDRNNQPIPGFTLDECKPLLDSQVHGVVSWKEGSGMPGFTTKPLRLHLRIRNADVYAFEFRE